MLGFDFSKRIVSVLVEGIEVCTYVFQRCKVLRESVSQRTTPQPNTSSSQENKTPTCVSLAPVSRIVSFADTGPLVLKSVMVKCECNWVSEN